MRKLRFLLMTIVMIGMILVVQPVQASTSTTGLGGVLYSLGGMVRVEILPIGPTGYTSDIYLDWDGHTTYIGTNRDAGTVVDVGPVTAGSQVGLRVYIRDTDHWIYMGPGAVNADGQIHDEVTALSSNTFQVGFEDIWGLCDADYNDILVKVTLFPPTTFDVPIDIKPGSCPNPINAGGGGTVSVAVVGTTTFNVSNVDPTTVRLVGAGGMATPVRWNREDAATPYQPAGTLGRNDCIAANGDGIADLVLKFNRDDILAALGPVHDGDVIVVTVTGQQTDGTDFQGTDVVWIR
jgi:hypothetical protein